MRKTYTVGYKKPPRETRFKKGQSGNPRGRPRSISQSDATLVAEVLNEMITVTENGKLQKYSLREAIEKKLYSSATEDPAAGRMLERYRAFINNAQFGPLTVMVRSKRF